VAEDNGTERRPNLSVLALISFTASFLVARTFTTLNPSAIFTASGIHVHHFWYGLAMLAIGGWLGISYNDARIDRLAAVLFGAGGGLIGDEIWPLLTFESENYWAGITYTLIVIFMASASILILLIKYSKIITSEFKGFTRRNASLYSGVFLAAVSIAFITETDNPTIITTSGVTATVASLIILAYFIQRLRRKQEAT